MNKDTFEIDEPKGTRVKCERCNEFALESEMEESNSNEDMICPLCAMDEFNRFCFQHPI
jgi:formylmethanofuran dehydrogenase subunit E